MKLLRLAIEKQNFELAAHVVILKAAEALKEGVKPDAKKQEPQRSPQGQPERA